MFGLFNYVFTLAPPQTTGSSTYRSTGSVLTIKCTSALLAPHGRAITATHGQALWGNLGNPSHNWACLWTRARRRAVVPAALTCFSPHEKCVPQSASGHQGRQSPSSKGPQCHLPESQGHVLTAWSRMCWTTWIRSHGLVGSGWQVSPGTGAPQICSRSWIRSWQTPVWDIQELFPPEVTYLVLSGHWFLTSTHHVRPGILAHILCILEVSRCTKLITWVQI